MSLPQDMTEVSTHLGHVDAKTFTPFIKKTGKQRTNRTRASNLSLKPPKFYIAGQGHYMIFNNVIQPFYT